jgi:hypothetical protein
LVDNQRIRGAKVAGVISLDLKPDRCVSNPPKSIVILTFRMIGNPRLITEFTGGWPQAASVLKGVGQAAEDREMGLGNSIDR